MAAGPRPSLALVLWLVISAIAACSGGSGGPGGSGGQSGHGGRGGSPADAGAGGDTGTDADGGPGPSPDAACSPVMFRLDAPDPADWFAPFSFSSCSPPNWLTVFDASGTDVGAIRCCTVASCDTCMFDVVCIPGFTGLPLPATHDWDGTMYLAGQCSTNQACVSPACAPPGRYTARMCGIRNGGSPVDPPTCVEVPFELPAAAPVVGRLPS